MLTSEYIEESLKPETNKIALVMLKLTNTDWVDDIRIVGNTTAVTHNAEVYEPYGVTFTAPTEGESTFTANVTIEDITRYLVGKIRGNLEEINLEAFVVFADTPDQIELGPWEFSTENINFAGYNVSFSVSKPNILKNSLSSFVLDSNNFPGLFFGI